VGIGTLWQQFLGGDVERAVYGEYGWDDEHLVQTGMTVEVEAFQVWEVMPAGLYEQLVEAVHDGTIVAHVQVRAESGTNEFSFPAGDAEIAGRPPCGGGLSYFVRHATEEIFAISTVAYDVIKSAGELVYADLKGHCEMILYENTKKGWNGEQVRDLMIRINFIPGGNGPGFRKYYRQPITAACSITS